MEKKLNLTKTVFYIFFAFCFLSAGIFCLNKNLDYEKVSAEIVESDLDLANRKTVDYFSVVQKTPTDSDTETSTLTNDTFLYSNNNYLSISLLTNGNKIYTGENALYYENVYFPDEEDLNNFQFYRNIETNLEINGREIDLTGYNFITSESSTAFPNQPASYPEKFEILFNNTGAESNAIKIVDENNKIIEEGVYKLRIHFTRYYTTNRKNGISTTTFESEGVDIEYSFYIFDKTSYIVNNNPDIKTVNFDSSIVTSNSFTENSTGFYLYSNYSSESGANKIPYIEYDPTRFEVDISKTLQNKTNSMEVKFSENNKQDDIEVSGDEFAYTKLVKDESNKTKCRIYFTELGNYNIKFTAIYIYKETDAENKVINRHRHYIDAVTNQTKTALVYMYGYQLTYTDHDKPLNTDGSHQTSEMKEYDYENSIFKNGADITSDFLNSNPDYSQANLSATFQEANIINYINNNNLAPVKTDQTPVWLNGNATLNQNLSYVFTTKQQSGYTQYGNTKLNGSQLYLLEKFNGTSLSTPGTYIYIVAYTFNNYRVRANQLSDTTVFYQIFYFEIYKSKASIKLTTAETNREVSSTEYYNESIILTDTTKQEAYNQDIEILIYAEDYKNGGYFANYGGEDGILFSKLDTDHDNIVILEESAHYSIWLYQKNTGITSKNEDYYFTIDKYGISYDDITARNVEQVSNSTDYEIISDVNGFATNQSFALSWLEKDSGAATTAYYKRFSLENYNFYKESTTSTQLSTFLLNHNSLPVNYALNLSTTGTVWAKLGNTSDNGNTLHETTVSGIGNFVLSASGLYLVDIYDEAGNHTVKVFLLDTTTPIFAVSDGENYSIPSSSIYITQSQNLYWGQNKLLRIINFNSFNYNNVKIDSNNEYYLEGSNKFVKDVINEYNFYKSRAQDLDKQYIYSIEIFEAMYKLYQDNNADNKPDYLDYYTFYSDTMTEYNGLYLKVPINSTSYYIDRNHSQYTKQTDVYNVHIGNEEEMTYRILIRDMSNTKKALDYADDAQVQYTNYFSAKQTIIISFDTSEFFINFKNSAGELEVLSSNTNEEDRVNSTKTTYLSPSSMNKAFNVSFIPTTVIAGASGESSKTIQISTVEAKYYKAGKETKVEKNGITYYYYELSDSYTIIPIYQYENVQNTNKISEEINATDNGWTAAGKYEITRTYYFGSGTEDTEYYCNDNDFITRTYVFYVDKYGVVTNPAYSEYDNKHSESMVGGDIFVTLYDNGTNADLLVSFPDSYNGNKNGNSIYNSGNLNVTSLIFATNKLPLKLYIPQMKYTKTVEMQTNGVGYDFNVDLNDPMNNFANNTKIAEYVLYAEIYKDNLRNLYAATTTDLNNPTLDSTLATANENGFLTFYHKESASQLNYLSEAGTYYVRIYQGRYGTEMGDNSFNQFLTFYFTIEDTAPDFTVRAENRADLIYDENDKTSDYSVKYHTNQSKLEIVWNEGSTYMADIDKANIMFKFKGSRQEINAKTIFPNIEALTPVNGKYVLGIDLTALGNYNIYSHDNYVDITMQYVNHDESIYGKPVTKRIYVDLSAPLTTINSLVTKVTSGTIGENGGSSRLSERMLRTRYQADGKTLATSDLNTCYNVSIATEPFAYYSFNVSNKTDEVKKLKDFAQTLLENRDYMTYVRAYSKSGSNAKYASTQNQETAPGDFRTSSFTEISQFISENGGFEVGTYYEVVETDLAGNMTIYTVYVTSYDASENENQDLISYLNGSNQPDAYTINDFTKTKNYFATNPMHSIYSNKGFVLQDINYFGDVWSQIYIRTKNAQDQVNTYYINLTPWDYAYDLINQKQITLVDLRNLIDGSVNSNYKHLLQIYDRLNSNTENFYININNPSLRYELTKEENKEYLSITSNPSDEQIKSPTTASSAFLTQLTITAILPDSDETIELYNVTNNLGFSDLWSNNENVEVIADTNLRTLTFNIRQSIGFTNNTRINYTFTDNYGKTYKEIHLYNESIITQDVTVPQGKYLYSYEEDGRVYYITDSTIQFNYNPRRYIVKVYDMEDGEITQNLLNAETEEAPVNGISVITITTTKQNLYNDSFAIVCYNAYTTDDTIDVTQTPPVKTIYFKLYNMLPISNETNDVNEPGQFKFLDTNGINITNEIVTGQASGDSGFYSEVRLQYNNNISMDIPVVYSYSKDKTNWTEITSNTMSFKCEEENSETYYIKVWYKEKYIENYHTSGYIFSYVPQEQIFEFTLTSLTQTYWLENTLTGEIIEKSDYVFETTSGSYTHYIINMEKPTSESDNRIKIHTNGEQQITYKKIGEVQDPTAEDVWTYIYRISNLDENGLPPENISAYEVNIAISYIPPTEKIVTEFYTYDETTGKLNTNNNLATQLSKEIIVLQSSTLSQIELQWSEYYGIKQNKINLTLFKDGIELDPTVYTRYSEDRKKVYSYVYLTHSGKYTISFKDTAGNEHRFSTSQVGQYKEFSLTFVKDVPFSVTYTNLMTGQQETTIPIREAIYNGSVTLKIDSTVLSSYYTYQCSVKRNGNDYTGFTANTDTWTYTFNETGYYQVTFSASTATSTNSAIRTETYQFTILDEDEYKYSYIVNPYSNYYIEKVVKDDIDVTSSLTQTLSVSKITVNGKTYMRALPLSYIDEKTGEGVYYITINSNNKLYKADSEITSWTFKVVIKPSDTVPIIISHENGSSTTDNIAIALNTQNIYEQLGRVTLVVVRINSNNNQSVYYQSEISSTSTGVLNATIDDTGTYLIQIYSGRIENGTLSGNNLIFSYKVIRNEPFNAATIIIIVVSVIVAVAIIFLIIKLRKRISVK